MKLSWPSAWMSSGRRPVSSSRSAAVGIYLGRDHLCVSMGPDRSDSAPISAISGEAAAVDLQQLVQSVGAGERIAGASAAVCLDASDYAIALVEKPAVPDEEVAEALRWRLSDQIEIDAADAVIEILDFPAAALRGRAPMTFVIVAERATLAHRLQLVEQTGLKVQRISIVEMAMRNYLRYLNGQPCGPQALLFEEGLAGSEDAPASVETVAGTLLIEPGGCIVNMFADGALYLSRRFDAAQLFGRSDSPQWEQARDALVLQIQRSLDYAESQLQKAPGILHVVMADPAADALFQDLTEMLPVSLRSPKDVQEASGVPALGAWLSIADSIVEESIEDAVTEPIEELEVELAGEQRLHA